MILQLVNSLQLLRRNTKVSGRFSLLFEQQIIVQLEVNVLSANSSSDSFEVDIIAPRLPPLSTY